MAVQDANEYNVLHGEGFALRFDPEFQMLSAPRSTPNAPRRVGLRLIRYAF